MRTQAQSKNQSNDVFGYTLHDGEEILLEVKPDKRAALYFTGAKIVRVIVLLAILAVIFFFQTHALRKTIHDFLNLIQHNLYWGVPAVIVLLIINFFCFKRMLNGYHYIMTNQRCILKYKLLSTNVRVIPYSKFSDIYIDASFLERVFGLASVYIDGVGMMSIGAPRGGLLGGRSSNSNNTTRMEALSAKDSQRVFDTISKFITK